jgi:ABC-type multidrug transport system fused ATPase/permease subunit
MGDIQFSNVYFFYPARSNVPILTNLSLKIKYGQTVALVGSSGSGKSTCVQLLQRFYNSQSGSILIDGKEMKEYNLKWLREHIGVVNQEPVLFHKTIRENILFGFDIATDEQIHQAAKMANAHDFIMALPNVKQK